MDTIDCPALHPTLMVRCQLTRHTGAHRFKVEWHDRDEPDPADECMSTDIDNCAVHGSFPSQQGR